MSASGGTRAIIAAFLANTGIAVTKFIAWFFSGSSSMLAEGVHSLADAGNQLLLIFGGRQAKKAADKEHPFGYGRERYVYAFVVSIILFSVGGVFSIYEGIEKLQHPHPLDVPWLPMLVLSIAIVLESFSLRTAVKESNHVRGKQSWVQFVRRAKAPELPVVLLEDVAALIGLVFAFIGVGLTWITGNSVFDAIGTLFIGTLLIVVAIVLGMETKSLLVGEGANDDDVEAIEQAILAGPEAERIIHMKTLYLGPDELLVAAKVGFHADQKLLEVSTAVNVIEQRVRAGRARRPRHLHRARRLRRPEPRGPAHRRHRHQGPRVTDAATDAARLAASARRTALVLRHDSAIGLGNLGPTLEAHGYEIVTVDAPHQDVAALDALAPDLVVVLGGDEAAYETDRYPYLADEIALLSARIAAEAPIFGVCLGAQLLAKTLGADVRKGPRKEVGWLTVEPTEAGAASPVRHFAGVPDGAVARRHVRPARGRRAARHVGPVREPGVRQGRLAARGAVPPRGRRRDPRGLAARVGRRAARVRAEPRTAARGAGVVRAARAGGIRCPARRVPRGARGAPASNAVECDEGIEPRARSRMRAAPLDR